MKPGEAPRWLWGRRALGLALGGGLVGWIVAYVGSLMFVQLLDQILVIWSVWFLVRRRARVPDSNSSPHP